MKNQAGIDFTANIPSEEVWTTPHKDRTEGVVTTTMPLCIDGVFIEGISLTFTEGMIIKLLYLETEKKPVGYIEIPVDGV